MFTSFLAKKASRESVRTYSLSMNWMAPENFLLGLAVLLILAGALLSQSILLIAGVLLFVGLIVYTIVSMAYRRKKLQNKNRKKD